MTDLLVSKGTFSKLKCNTNTMEYFPWSEIYVVVLEIYAAEKIWYFLSIVVREFMWWQDWFLNWLEKFDLTG